ncbi:hypothetical protein OJF2_13080 [Aquisphaera giovannonii]|uniref:Uncharacterized protein n=1 Tax=Aquisphaera giovannonii TaxID=406548 RepID=A0A5B9VXL1_9BACT|nr:hypothetical protein [Aquisphaera giovannonii]QEH32824.1 hypothetical protein OJF2_13080 [Aquisphaera giovannonii]
MSLPSSTSPGRDGLPVRTEWPGRHSPSRILLGALAALLAAAGSPRPATAAPPVEIQSVRVGLGGENSFKVGCWTPIRIQLHAGASRFSGQVELLVPDDDGILTSYRTPAEVAAGSTATVAAYARPGSREFELKIRLLDAQGARLLEVNEEQVLPSPPKALLPFESAILTLGQPMGVDQVPLLPGFVGSSGGAAGATPEVVIQRIEAPDVSLPGRWYGYDSARAIVVDTNDREGLKALDGLRGEALVDWVRHGGHLVVSVGSNWQAVRDSVLGPVLPAVPNGQQRLPSLDAIEVFAASTRPLAADPSTAVMATKLEGADRRRGKVLAFAGNLHLIVRGAYGFGRVTLIGLDVDQKLFGDWADRGLFWARALDLHRDNDGGEMASPAMGGGRIYQSGVSDLSSQLRIGLEQFPGVKLVPFGWVAFFIFLYILLIGPGDYLFLRKVVRRMELTWITFPLIVLTVSLVAYFAAYRLKGNDLRVNKVDVIDADQEAGLLRGRTIATVFSPQNRDYGVGFVPVAPDREGDVAADAGPAPAEGPLRPPSGTELVTSWFSVPEAQFGGIGGGNRHFNLVGGTYAYAPAGSLERLEGVRIPIWSTRSVTARWFGRTGALVEANLRPVGTDRLAGTITNRLGYPLTDALLAFGKQVYLLDELAPGATVKVELSSDRNLAGELRSRAPSYSADQYRNARTSINRGNLLLAAMFHESESGRAGGDRLSNVLLNELDLTGQLALDRPMLVARIGRPGAQLALENVPSRPKIDQTTLLRIILPLGGKKPAPGAADVGAADGGAAVADRR